MFKHLHFTKQIRKYNVTQHHDERVIKMVMEHVVIHNHSFNKRLHESTAQDITSGALTHSTIQPSWIVEWVRAPGINYLVL